MKKSDDLREGNRVIDAQSGTAVTILKVEDSGILLDTFPRSDYYPHKNISGIPLTTSMLEKLSFTNDEEADKWSGCGLNIYIKPDGFYYGLRIFKSRAKIQYLHQLQNYISDFYAVFKDEKRSLNLSPLQNFYTA